MVKITGHVLWSLILSLKGFIPSVLKPNRAFLGSSLKALVWFWLIDETLSANLVYQDDHEIGSTTPSDEAMAKIMTMMMVW